MSEGSDVTPHRCVCVCDHICKRAQTGKMGERQQAMGDALSDGRTKETPMRHGL